MNDGNTPMSAQEALEAYMRLHSIEERDLSDDELDCLYRAGEAAIQALREKQAREHPEPLTVEQLREMDEEPVWVVDIGRVRWGNQWCVFDGDDAYIPGVSHWWYSADNYGETWLAYAHKPGGEV